jgi:hypothetical protein
LVPIADDRHPLAFERSDRSVVVVKDPDHRR